MMYWKLQYPLYIAVVSGDAVSHIQVISNIASPYETLGLGWIASSTSLDNLDSIGKPDSLSQQS